MNGGSGILIARWSLSTRCADPVAVGDD